MREMRVRVASIFSAVLVMLGTSATTLQASEKSNGKSESDVIVLQSGDFLPPSAKPVKNIELGGAELSDYSYHELIDKARQLAFQSDANVIKIKQRIRRSGQNSNEKIIASFYKVDNVRHYEKELAWSKDRKLTWDDFRGPIPADADHITAAATYCGIGFETNSVSSRSDNLRVRVYNTFYTNHSWGRPEEMNDNVLAHEQGHYDLCELYTRKQRQRLATVKVDAANLKPVLRTVYGKVQEEYKARQAAYEDDTQHGVDLAQQKRWQKIIERELAATEQWGSTESLTLAFN